jgi:RNA polymerase sigma-70 factor (ECF subfamily)
MASDPEILAQLAAGRPVEAFEMLLDTYQHKVFRLAYSMLGERAQAEDAAQEIFLRIWKALARYRGDSALGTWIYSVARNACLTAIAKRAARRDVPLEEPKPASTPPSPPDVLRFVAQLPDNQRQAVMLYYMDERSYEEVARLLDMPLGTVKTNLRRARKQLAMMMKESA